MSQRRLPAEIYWRRRLLLLAVVIAVIWGVLQVTSGGGDDEEPVAAPASATTATKLPTASATPVVPTTPSVKRNGLVDVAVATAETPCDPEKVRITPTVRPGQLTKGPVDIGLVVSSTDPAACTLMPADADTIAVISANGTAIWDSTVCKASLLTTPIGLSPQWSTMAVVQWTGRGSGSHCTTNEGWATPGKYTIQIGTLGGEPGKASFTLDPRPAAPKAEVPATPAPAASPTAPVVTDGAAAPPAMVAPTAPATQAPATQAPAAG